jgi:hypothetical protein
MFWIGLAICLPAGMLLVGLTVIIITARNAIKSGML